MCFPGCSVLDICRTPEPQREPTPPPRTTYVVKVYERTVISRTEFPNAIPTLVTPTKERPKSSPLPTTDPNISDDESIDPSTTKRPTITPRDQNRLMRLRQDPSVVSLLNMYDSNGQLDKKVFSNTPAKDDPNYEEQVYAVGRPQHQRKGSTLRQLMGKPELEAQPNTSRSEGEISWAERLLQYVPCWTAEMISLTISPGKEMSVQHRLPPHHRLLESGLQRRVISARANHMKTSAWPGSITILTNSRNQPSPPWRRTLVQTNPLPT